MQRTDDGSEAESTEDGTSQSACSVPSPRSIDSLSTVASVRRDLCLAVPGFQTTTSAHRVLDEADKWRALAEALGALLTHIWPSGAELELQLDKVLVKFSRTRIAITGAYGEGTYSHGKTRNSPAIHQLYATPAQLMRVRATSDEDSGERVTLGWLRCVTSCTRVESHASPV
jgi:hypothetical protein